MKPTLQLRWAVATPKQKEGPTSANALGYIMEHWVLQQLWEDGEGNAEWRNIELEPRIP